MVPGWTVRSIPRRARVDPKRLWSPTASMMGSAWILGWPGVGIGSPILASVVPRTIIVLRTIDVPHTISQPRHERPTVEPAPGRGSGRTRRPGRGSTSKAEPQQRRPGGRDGFDLVWARPERPPRGRARGLDRQQVVRAAITIADHQGLDALTMRRVA